MIRKRMKANKYNNMKIFLMSIIVIFLSIVTIGKNFVYGAVPIDGVNAGDNIIIDTNNQAQIERRRSVVSTSASGGGVRFGQLTKQEAGYRQSSLGGQLSKAHEIQQDDNWKKLGSSESFDSNVSYQHAIILDDWGHDESNRNCQAVLSYDNIGTFNNRNIGIELTFSDIKVKTDCRENVLVRKVAELNPDNVLYHNIHTPDKAMRDFRDWYKNEYKPGATNDEADAKYLSNARILQTVEALPVEMCEETGVESTTCRFDRIPGTTPYIVYTDCYYSGFYYRNIQSASVKIRMFYTDAKDQTVDLNNWYFTANSLNVGEGIFSNDISKAYARTDTLVVASSINTTSGRVDGFCGTEGEFTDQIGADDFTKASVTVVSAKSTPTFVMGTTDKNIYWWTLLVGPYTVNAGRCEKVVLNSSNAEQKSLNNAKIGDTLTFKLKQKVSSLGITSSEGYSSYTMVDELPRELTYVEAYVENTSTGQRLNSADYSIGLSNNNKTITASFSSEFLKYNSADKSNRRMQYVGETYSLVIKATVNTGILDNTTGTFQNTGYTKINNSLQSNASPVTITPTRAQLSITKSANKYESKVGETVNYTITVKNTMSGSIAKDVTITDTSLPVGLRVSSASDAITVNAPATWNNNVTGSNVAVNTRVTTQRSGTGAIVTVDKLEYNKTVTINLKCVATDSVNGKETVNTATAVAANANQVSNKAEVYVNTATLSMDKTVDRYEHVVGDEITYTVKIKNTVEGTIADNVVISDNSIPEGLTLIEGSLSMTGVPSTVARRIAGSDTVANETQSVAVTSSIRKNGSNGWQATISALPYNREVTIVFKCTATEAVNGKETVNTATVVAGNANQVSNKAEVYVNTAILSIDKTVDKYEHVVGDEITYTVKVKNTRENTIANNLIISDNSIPEGLALIEGSLSMTGVPETVTRRIAGSDTIPNETQSEAVTSSIGKRGSNGWQAVISALPYNREVTITFKCTATETANGKENINTVRAVVNNGAQVNNKEEVYVNTAKLFIDKTVDKYEHALGDEVVYTVKVKNTKEGTIANNMVVQDISIPVGLTLIESSLNMTGVPDTVIRRVAGSDTVPDETQVEEVTSNLAKSGDNGWKATISALPYDVEVVITFKCLATEAVNGLEIANRATVVSNNGTQVDNQAEIWINTPTLEIQKNASKYEWRVGDSVDYTVKVKNTKEGTIAHNVVISDFTLPVGLTISNVFMTGVPENVLMPIANQDNLHGEKEVVEVVENISKKNDSSWEANISELDYNHEVTIVFHCEVDEALNGMEVINTAHFKASNAAEVENEEKIWVNSPEVKIEKQVDTQPVAIGDIITYEIKTTNLKVGTVARNVVIEDNIETEGVKLQKSSIVLMDSTGKVIPQSRYDLTIQNNQFKIETKRTLVNPDDNYSIWDLDSSTTKIEQEKWNPLGLTKETSFTVEYQVKVVDKELAGMEINNKASITCDEGTSDETEEIVQINGPHLAIKKESNESIYKVGDTAHYEITIRQIRENYEAKEIVITDELQNDQARISKDTIKVHWNEEEITPKTIQMNEQENGFTIETGKNLNNQDIIKATYDVELKDMDAEIIMENTATAKGKNAPEVKDTNKVYVDRGVNPILKTTKTVENPISMVGARNKYKIEVMQIRETVKAKDVVIEDVFAQEGAKYVDYSMKVILDGNDITKACQITIEENKFKIVTNRSLSIDQKLEVEYEVQYSKEAGGKTIKNTALAKGSNTPEVPPSEVEVQVEEPKLTINKYVEKEISNPGEENTYTLKVKQEKQNTTINNIVIEDKFLEDGSTYLPGTMKIYNKNGNEITENCNIIYSKNSFKIETKESLGYNESITVRYDVKYAEALPEKTIINLAWAIGQNGEGVKTDPIYAEKRVEIKNVKIVTEKVADKLFKKAGEMNQYTIQVKQVIPGQTAKDVVIVDKFEENQIEYVENSMKVRNTRGEDITSTCEIIYNGNGFTIYTGKNLSYGETIKVTYEVKYNPEEKIGALITNEATTKAKDESGKIITSTANEIVEVQNGNRLHLLKTAQKEVCNPGDSNVYTIIAKQEGAEALKDVVIQDYLQENGVTYKQDSIKVYDITGKDITENCQISFAEKQLTIRTGKTLQKDESITIKYEVNYTNTIREKTVTNTAIVTGTNESGKKITDDAKKTVELKVINLVTEKIAEKPVCEEGNENSYTIKVTQKEPDQVYKNIIIKDNFDQKGVVYTGESLQVKDKENNDITKDCKITFEETGFTIETGKELAYEESITVNYKAKYLPGTAGKIVKNVVVSKGINVEGQETEGTAQEVVVVEKAKLTISKKAEKERCNINEKNTYTIEVKSIGKMVAKDIVIEDKIANGAIYQKDSLKIYNQEGNEIKANTIYDGNSFKIELENGLERGENIKIQYQVIYQELAAGKTIKNTAIAKGSNTEEASTEGTTDGTEEKKGAEANVKINTKLQEAAQDFFAGKKLPKTGVSIVILLLIAGAVTYSITRYLKWKKTK